jgi:hypothetical protein
MKITRRLADSAACGDTVGISLEFFAPEDGGVDALRARLSRLACTEPLFVDFVGSGDVCAARRALCLASFARRARGLTACLPLAARTLRRLLETTCTFSAATAGWGTAAEIWMICMC